MHFECLASNWSPEGGPKQAYNFKFLYLTGRGYLRPPGPPGREPPPPGPATLRF